MHFSRVLGGLPSQFSHTTTAPPVKKSKFKERRAAKQASQTGVDVEDQFESEYFLKKRTMRFVHGRTIDEKRYGNYRCYKLLYCLLF